MSKKITQPIRTRIARTGQQAQDTLTDIWSRLDIRQTVIYTRSGKIEDHIKKGQSYDAPIEKQVNDLSTLFNRSAITNELVISAIAQLVSAIGEQAEEFSQAEIETGLMRADMEAQRVEYERAQKLATEQRYDIANIATASQELELFTLEDVDTIKANLVKVNKVKFTQALKGLDEDSWQRIFEAFITAKDER